MMGPTEQESRDDVEFRIPSPNVGRFRKKIAALNRRAVRLGLAPLDLEELGVEVELEEIFPPTGYAEDFSPRDPVKVRREWLKVRLTGERPKLEGWTLLGTISHEDGGNVLSSAPGQTIPESYRASGPNCDHCGTSRRRRDTMVIEKDGEIKQIGRNCLQDFIGDVNVEGITWYYKTWPELDDYCERSGGGFSSDYIKTEVFLTAVACAIRNFGFASLTTARNNENVTSTVSVAWDILFPPKKRLAGVPPPPKILDEDKAAAADVLAWIVNDLGEQENLHGYLANLRAACSGGWARQKHAGLIASAFRGRENYLEGQERRKNVVDRKKQWAEERATEKNEHFGTVKERSQWTLKIISTQVREGDWGEYTMILMKDLDGRLAVWYSSGSGHDGLERGKVYEIKGTVKRHDLWTPKDDEDGPDTCCTVLNRCVVVREVIQ